MEVTGIVSEYNPFHNGHKFHIDKTLGIAGGDVIAVMSGSFVQRGEPAIMDKWSRTKCALLNGISIVLELPSIFSTASAETFAFGAVKMLNETGIVQRISFGNESGDIETLKKAAVLLSSESPSFSSALKHNLSKGMSFPAARQAALEKVYNSNFEFISSPNNILAVEYLKALSRLNSSIEAFAVKRKGEGYNSEKISHMASASAIRKAIKEKSIKGIENSMPETAYEVLIENIDLKKAPIFLDNFYSNIAYLARAKSSRELSEIYGIEEGLENRIKAAFSSASSIEEAICFTKSKRYTRTAVQRAFIHMLLGIKSEAVKNYISSPIPYIRVLGFRKEKERLLGSLVKNSSVPVIINTSKAFKTLNADALEFLKMECAFTDIYFMACENPSFRQIGQDFTKQVVIV